MRIFIRVVVFLALVALAFLGVIDQFIDFMGEHYARALAKWVIFFLCWEHLDPLVNRALRRWLPDEQPDKQPVA
jgi:hypothetical protein